MTFWGEVGEGLRNVMRFQQRFIREHRLVFIMISVAYLAAIWALSAWGDPQKRVLVAEFVELFRAKPRLEIVIGPTEQYTSKVRGVTLTLKRIELVARDRSLESLRVTVSSAVRFDEVRLNTNLAAGCKLGRFSSDAAPILAREGGGREKGLPEEGKALFEIACNSVSAGQRVEISLVSSSLDQVGRVVVEAIGGYGKARFVGASATGLL